jgi:hypothetical protein
LELELLYDVVGIIYLNIIPEAQNIIFINYSLISVDTHNISMTTLNHIWKGGWQLWLRLMLANIITGGASTVLSALGITGAKALGVKVVELDFNSIVVMFISGGIIGFFSYIKQSPLPNIRN